MPDTVEPGWARWYAPELPREAAFHCRFFVDLVPLRDADDRPLVESYARDAARTDYQPCRYAGSRRGLQLNRTALLQMTRHWAEFVGGIDVIRRELPQGDGLEGLWSVATSLTFLPCYFYPRFARERVPSFVASIFKASLDIVTTADLMLAASFVGALERGRDTAAGMAAFAEERGLLVNGAWVCAGSPRQIEETLSTILKGATTRHCAPAPMRALLDAHADDLAVFMAGMQALYLAGQLYQAGMLAAWEGLFALLHRSGQAPAPRLFASHPSESVYETRRRELWRLFASEGGASAYAAGILALGRRSAPSAAERLGRLAGALPPRPATVLAAVPAPLEAALADRRRPPLGLEHVREIVARFVEAVRYESLARRVLGELVDALRAQSEAARAIPFDVELPLGAGRASKIVAEWLGCTVRRQDGADVVAIGAQTFELPAGAPARP